MKKVFLMTLLGLFLMGCESRSGIDCRNRGGEMVKSKSGKFVCAKLA
jgi:uncharacterized protein YcfL